MALITCPECGKQISDQAATCPNCGYPINNSSPVPTQNTMQQTNVAADGGSYPAYSSGVYSSAPNEKKSKPKKKRGCLTTILTIIGIFIVICVLLSFCGQGSDETTTSETTAQKSKVTADTSKETEVETTESETVKETESKEEKETESTTQAEESKPESVAETKSPLEKELAKSLKLKKSGKYKFITAGSLAKYAPNLKGKKVYVVGKAESIDSDEISITTSKGTFNFSTKVDYTNLVEEGSTVAIFGKVSDYSKILGYVSIDLKGARIFAVGKTAKKYKKEKADSGLKKYLKMTAKVADFVGEDNISKKEYIALCKDYSYKKILRNPDKYDGKYCYVKGSVDQIIEGWFSTDTIYIVDNYGNKWECSYSYGDDESKILEGDNITVYGVCGGTTTSTTVLGKQVTMPEVEVAYYK